MLSIVYFVQMLTSAFIYYVHMRKLNGFKVIYRNMTYLKIAICFLSVFVLSFAFLVKTNIVILFPFLTFFAFSFLKKFYKNIIMETDDYLYNGVATMKKSAIKKVFIENGVNLEKKYKVKYIGIEKYKKADYLIFEFNSDNYVLVKNFDKQYLSIMHTKFNLI